MLHVFIDTNVYLTFFSFTEEDLEELRKLLVAINNRELKLWTTAQVSDELRRNREAKVAESLAALRKLKPVQAIPQMARNLPEFNDFVAAKREFERHLNALNEQLAQQFHDGSLAADAVLGELLTAAKNIEVDDATVAAAQRRTAIGNPPGKKGSLGDAINWECLLAAFPDSRDLHLVTGDSDFVSRMSSDHVSTYLAEEWRDEKHSEIHLHRRISSFLKDRFPNIAVASELEKELRIRQLVESPSFAETHRAVSALASYTDYSEQQAKELLEAAVMNSQIASIARDPDVHEFFTELDERYGHLLDATNQARFAGRFGPDDEKTRDRTCRPDR